MKTYKVTKGPFKERPHYKLEEIEEICLSELKIAGLLPEEPKAIRIDRFIEKKFRISHSYDALPHGLLGFTKFGPSGVEEIVVSRDLAEEGSEIAERRITTTLAHEAGHGLLHAHLFVLGMDNRGLFNDNEAIDQKVPKILCRNGVIPGISSPQQSAYDGRWWEFQANRAIGALLMPRPLVLKCLRPFINSRGVFDMPILDASQREGAEGYASSVFNVNPIVARIRINEIFPGDSGQLTL